MKKIILSAGLPFAFTGLCLTPFVAQARSTVAAQAQGPLPNWHVNRTVWNWFVENVQPLLHDGNRIDFDYTYPGRGIWQVIYTWSGSVNGTHTFIIKNNGELLDDY